MGIASSITNVDLPSQEAEVLPSTFSDIVGKAAYSTWLNFNSNSAENAYAEADEEQAEQYLQATGESIESLYPSAQEYEEAQRTGNNEFFGATGRRKYVNNKIAELRAANPGQYIGVNDIKQVDERAAEVANTASADLQEAQYYTSSNSPGAAGFVGALPAALIDPINLATLPLGMGFGATLGKLVATEAAIGVATELAIHKPIADWQKKIGQEYGLDDLAMNVVFAGVGAAGLAAAGRGASVLFNNAANKYTSAEPMKAVLKSLSDDAHLKGNDPSTTIYGSKAHLEAYDFGRAAMDRGTMPDPKLVDKSNREFFLVKQDMEHVDWMRTGRERGLDFDNQADLDHYIKTTLAAQGIRVELPERPKFSKEVQDTDEILAAIAKLGGISRKDAAQQGIDPESFKMLGSGIKRTFTNEGKGFDDMATTLSQYGYMKEGFTANDLLDMVSDSLGGRKVYTPEGAVKARELEQADEMLQRSEELELENAYQVYEGIDASRVVDDISDSLKELDAEAAARPEVTEAQYKSFDDSLTEWEIFPANRTAKEIDGQLDQLERPEVDAADVANFDRILEADENMKVYLDDEVLTMKDLKARFADDEKMLADITSCAI